MRGTNNFHGNEFLALSGTVFAKIASLSENVFGVTAAVVEVIMNTIWPDYSAG